MNKQGSLMGYWIFIILIIAFFGVGQQAHDKNQSIENISNYEWNYTAQTNLTLIDDANSVRVNNIIHKGIDATGYIIIEMAKWATEFGYSHPQYDYIWFAKILVYWLVFLTIWPAFIIIFYLAAFIYTSHQAIQNWRNRR